MPGKKTPSAKPLTGGGKTRSTATVTGRTKLRRKGKGKRSATGLGIPKSR